MRDPLEELRNLSAAGPALPAEEVRRRGDRMRRRRTALQAVGAAVAVAAIASGGAAMTGSLTSSTPPAGPAAPSQSAPPSATPSPAEPTPTETPSAVVSPLPSSPAEPAPDGGWRTEIPGDVVDAVRATLPRAGGDVPGAVEDSSPDLPWWGLPCGDRGDGEYAEPLTSTWLAGLDGHRTDQRFVSVSPPASFQARQLVVYEKGEVAADVLAAIGQRAEQCPPEPDPDLPTELRWAADPLELDGAEGLLLSGGSFVEDTDDRTIGRTLVTVVRRGNAVLTAVLSDESSAALDALDDPDSRALLDATTRLADRMCVFSTEGCAG